MSDQRPRWRRQWIVDDLQYRLLMTNLAYFLVGMSIVGAVVFVPLVFEVRNTDVPAIQRSMAASELLTLHRRFWPGLALAFVLLGVHSVLTSHRISGPLYRFRKVLRIAAAGDMSSDVRLRKHDFLADEANAINELLQSQRDRDADLRSTHARLEECAATLDRCASASDPAWKEEVARLRDAIDAFGGRIGTGEPDPEEGR